MAWYDFLTPEDEEIQGQEPPSVVPPQPVQPAVPPPAPMPAQPMGVVQPPDRQAAINQYLLAKKQGDESFSAAKERSQQMNTRANIGQGLGQIFSAKGQSYGARPPDTGVYDAMRQQAAQGLQTAQGDRQRNIQDYLTQNRLDRQGVTEGREDVQYARMNEKGTPEAQLLAQQINKFSPGAVADPKSVSLVDLNNIKQTVEFGANLEAKKSDAETNALMKKSAMDDRARGLADKEASTEKAKTLVESSPSGRNKYIRDLAQGINRAAHAEGMVYPDGTPVLDKNGELIINKMTPQFIEELKQAWSMLLSGAGGSSMGEREKLEFNSAYSQFQKGLGYLQNKPLDAGSGEYVRMVADSLNRQKQISENQLKEHVVRVFMNASKWRAFDPDGWKEALYRVTSYNGRPGVDAAADINEKGTYTPKKVVAAGKEGGDEFKNYKVGQSITQNGKKYIWNGSKMISADEYEKQLGTSTAQNQGNPFGATQPFKKAVNWMNTKD